MNSWGGRPAAEKILILCETMWVNGFNVSVQIIKEALGAAGF